MLVANFSMPTSSTYFLHTIRPLPTGSVVFHSGANGSLKMILPLYLSMTSTWSRSPSRPCRPT